MKFVWLILLIANSVLYGNALTIDEQFISSMSGDYQTNYEDPKKAWDADKILHDSTLKVYPKHFSTYSKSVFWSQFKIKNASAKSESIVLRNLRSGTDYVDVYLYRNGTLYQKILLGDLRSQEKQMILSTKSAFYVTLAPNDTITIVSRFDCLGSYDLQWEVSTTRHYSSVNSFELWFWGVFGGLISALILYNLTMYLNLKKTVFLAYIVHAGLLLWFQYAYSGVLFFLNTGINMLLLTLSTWIIPQLMLSVLGLFILLFFEFNKHNRFLTYLISSLVFINAGAAFVLSYAFINSDLLLYSNYFLMLAFVTLLIYFLIGIYAIYHRYPGGWYYLLGQGTYIGSIMYLIFVLAGQTPMGYLIYLIPISILIEMFAFSLALGSWVKKLRIEHEKSECLMIDEARFISIGKNIGMAVHQWKDPLSQLGSHIVYLKAKEYLGEPLSLEVRYHIDQMEQLIEHMKQTTNDLYESCTNVQSIGEFDLEEAILITLRFLQDRLILSNVQIESLLTKGIVATGSKNALVNILRILIDNSLNQFQKEQTHNPTISIKTKKDDMSITVIFEDNGGGIAISPIDNIFNINTSTRGSKGTGMGLAMAKLLVEKRLDAKIQVMNTADSARFEIVIPIKK